MTYILRLDSLNNTSCPPYFLKFFSISDMCSMKSWIQHFYLVTLYIASLNVWLTQAALLGDLRKHDNPTLKRWNFPQKGTDGSPLIFRTYSTCTRSAPKEIPNAIFIFTSSKVAETAERTGNTCSGFHVTYYISMHEIYRRSVFVFISISHYHSIHCQADSQVTVLYH